MYELINIRQIPGEKRRRWFTSVDMDLIIWFNADHNPSNFELCYNKQTHEKSLRWSASGIEHSAVDGGENTPGRYKSTPVLREASRFDADKIKSLFAVECTSLPADIVEFVMSALDNPA